MNNERNEIIAFILNINFLQSGTDQHVLKHYWFTAWPDHKAPCSASQILRLALEVLCERERVLSLLHNIRCNTPHLHHLHYNYSLTTSALCSAGSAGGSSCGGCAEVSLPVPTRSTSTSASGHTSLSTHTTHASIRSTDSSQTNTSAGTTNSNSRSTNSTSTSTSPRSPVTPATPTVQNGVPEFSFSPRTPQAFSTRINFQYLFSDNMNSNCKQNLTKSTSSSSNRDSDFYSESGENPQSHSILNIRNSSPNFCSVPNPELQPSRTPEDNQNQKQNCQQTENLCPNPSNRPPLSPNAKCKSPSTPMPSVPLTSVPVAPVVVHCSAGVGRTGCFLAIYNGILQLLSEGSVDILGIVAKMRMERGGLVQTAEQYEFIYRYYISFHLKCVFISFISFIFHLLEKCELFPPIFHNP